MFSVEIIAQNVSVHKTHDWMCVDIETVNMNEIYREGSALQFLYTSQ